ncbi:prolyl oligopeptidase family serine peptidase [Candidatus Bathyarchaeota archaeon]|nr:prolyl oligopeptidase family serine peptidase [Candidatus Bathyarchaeota archaeon]
MSKFRIRDGEQKVFFKAGGEWCYLWTPESFSVEGKVPVVIHHHGARGYVKEGSADWLEEENKVSILRAVMEGGGCAIAGSHACGDHWGNPAAVEADKALYEALFEIRGLDMGRVGLMGGGLGGALIWNMVLGPLSGKVKAVAVMQAVASLESIIIRQRFKAPCLRAYGLPEDTPDWEAVERIRPHDPLPRLKRLTPHTPLPRVVIYHGAKDANIPPEDHAIPIWHALRGVGGEAALELFPDVEHNVYMMGKAIEDRLREFFRSSL